MIQRLKNYFYVSQNPLSANKKLNLQNVFFFALIVSLVIFVVYLFWPTRTLSSPTPQGVLNNAPNDSYDSTPALDDALSAPTDIEPITAPTSPQSSNSRQYSASQVILPSNDQHNSVRKLPMATAFKALLANTLVSSDIAVPAIALVAECVISNGEIIFPQGAKLLGTSALDARAKRLQIRFHHVVFPDGTDSSISAVALDLDGSYGLRGDYKSGNTQKQVGKFSGTFLGGLAEGLKDKQAAGAFLPPIASGSIKNGLLNAVSDTALDQVNSFSSDLQSEQPSISVPSGLNFLVYLEQGYSK